MENTSYVALSQQTAAWRQLSTVANNIANMDTPGFKAEHPVFTDYLEKSYHDERLLREKLYYVQDFGSVIDGREGPVRSTGNPLDLAISGDGFFAIETPEGEAFTRNGRFQLDVDGQIVNSSGLPVLSIDDTPLFIAPTETSISVSGDGTVSTENGIIGRLKIMAVDDIQNMEKVAGNLMKPNDPQVMTPVEIPRVTQGMLEGSNVNSINEMTKMIDLNRHYVEVQKMIEAEHERTKKAMQTFMGQSG